MSVKRKQKDATPRNHLASSVLKSDMTRPISSQLKGNLPYITYKEALALQKKIQSISTALQTIQLEKAILRSKERMQTEIFLKSRRDEYAARLSLFQHLPPEIWERVFIHIPEEIIVVSQVCRVWRRLAVAIPHLWPKELLVYLHPLRPQEQDATSETLYACMVRTSEWPGLSMCLLNRKHAPLPSPVTIRLNLRAIPRRTPLKALYVMSEFLGDLFGDTYLHKSFWAPLEELVVDQSPKKRSGGNSLNVINANALSLSHLRSLTRLTVRLTNRISPSNFHAPWRQLEYLHLDASHSRVADYIGILSLCQRLRTFILVCYTSVPRRESTVNRVLVSRLENLTIIGRDSVAALLTHLKLPALKCLHLSAQMHPSARTRRYKDSGEDIMRIIETSGCTLTELTVDCIHFDDSDIPYCFRAMPKLRILRVADNGGMADLLTCLREGYRDSGGAPMPLVPWLDTLLVSTNTPAHWPDGPFKAVCNLRRRMDIRGSEGNHLKRSELVLDILPFSVDAELSRYVQSLLDVEGVTLDAPYIAKRRPAAAVQTCIPSP